MYPQRPWLSLPPVFNPRRPCTRASLKETKNNKKITNDRTKPGERCNKKRFYDRHRLPLPHGVRCHLLQSSADIGEDRLTSVDNIFFAGCAAVTFLKYNVRN